MKSFLLTLLVFVTPFFSQAQWKGEVIKVIDGDTYKVVKKDGSQTTVRLFGVDCPEKNQPYGSKAEIKVSKKIKGKTVSLEKVETGPYNRLICKVRYKSRLINQFLVKKGLAWVS
jgi:endonuclease YncB( thermonuclease family)